jgi:replicative DNA helicase
VSAEEEADRLPPHDRAAEQITVGGMMLSKDTLADVAEIISARDLYVPMHRLVFGAIIALDKSGCPAEPVAVEDRLRDLGHLDLVGGTEGLRALVKSVPRSADPVYYAGLVRAKAVERRVIATGQELVKIGWQPGLDLDEKMGAAWRRLADAADMVSTPLAASLAELLPAAMDRIEAGPPPGAVMSGWPELDDLTGGTLGGQLVTVGARPSVGKSVVLSNWAVAAALAAVPVLYYSLEMGRAQCLNRMLAAEARVDLRRIRGGADVLSDEEWARLGEAMARLGAAPLRLNDAATLRVADVRADLRRAERAGEPAGLVVIDYAQLITPAQRNDKNRQAEVAEITHDLREAAKEHDAAMLVGAQLNRGPEMRSNRRPVLADLRDSGSFEQDSDVVILLARDGAYEEDTTGTGDIEFIVAKHRAGERRTLTLDFHGSQARVEEQPWTPFDAVPPGPASGPDVRREEREDDLARQRARRKGK